MIFDIYIYIYVYVCVWGLSCVCVCVASDIYIHTSIYIYTYMHTYIHTYVDCRPDAGACSVLEYLQEHQPGYHYGTCSDDLAPVVFIRACEHPK